MTDSLHYHIPTIHTATCTESFEPYFDDEINVIHGTQVAVITVEKTKNMMKVKTLNEEGWIPIKSISHDHLKTELSRKLEDQQEVPWVSKEVPKRIEQLYRQRRIA